MADPKPAGEVTELPAEPTLTPEERKAIRRLLEAYIGIAGKTRKQLDEELGATPGHTSRFLRGEARFTVEEADRIARLLGVDRKVAVAMREAAEIHLPPWWPRNESPYRYDYPEPPVRAGEVGLRDVLAVVEDFERALRAQLPPEMVEPAAAKAGAAKRPEKPRQKKSRRPPAAR